MCTLQMHTRRREHSPASPSSSIWSSSLRTGEEGNTSLVPGVGGDSVGRNLDGAEELPSGTIEVKGKVHNLIILLVRPSDPFQEHGGQGCGQFGGHLDSLVALVELSALNCQTCDDESLLIVNSLLLLFLRWIEVELQLRFLERPLVELSSSLLCRNQESLR